MTSTVSLKRGLLRVRRESRSKRFDRALAELQRLMEDRPDHPQLLTMRAALIQLQDVVDGTPTLEDAKNDLLLAVELDDQSPSAWLDLAFFVYAVENDTRASLKYFQKAIQISRRLLKDSLLGQAEALAELEQDAKAEQCLMEALQLAPRNGKSDGKEILERLMSLQRAD